MSTNKNMSNNPRMETLMICEWIDSMSVACKDN